MPWNLDDDPREQEYPHLYAQLKLVLVTEATVCCVLILWPPGCSCSHDREANTRCREPDTQNWQSQNSSFTASSVPHPHCPGIANASCAAVRPWSAFFIALLLLRDAFPLPT